MNNLVLPSRDDFSEKVKTHLAKRASFVCSNPDCRALTIAPSDSDSMAFIYIGKAAHISAAASGGPRFDPTLTSEQRSSIDNGIFLCASCADMIDKNNGIDFPTPLLEVWKTGHAEWVRGNLNKSVTSLVSVVDGEHHARGIGEVTGLDAQSAVFIQPGTKVSAEGVGKITATRIGGGNK